MQTDFVGRGWAFPLEVNAGGRIATVGGARRLEQAMRLVLATHPGERPLRPEFGSRLRDYVFAGATVEVRTAIAAEVTRSLTRWEPRVDVHEVQVLPDRDNPSLLHIDISYVVRTQNDPRNLVFPFYTIPDEEGQ